MLHTEHKPSVLVVDYAELNQFQAACEDLVKKGYKVNSSNCGFLNSEAYSFCASYQAIFVLPDAMTAHWPPAQVQPSPSRDPY